MGKLELSLMKNTILVLRDWDAFQVTCRQGLKWLRIRTPKGELEGPRR